MGLSSWLMPSSVTELVELMFSEVTCKWAPSSVPSLRRRAVLAADSFSKTMTAVWVLSAPGVRVMDEILQTGGGEGTSSAHELPISRLVRLDGDVLSALQTREKK